MSVGMKLKRLVRTAIGKIIVILIVVGFFGAAAYFVDIPVLSAIVHRIVP